MGVNVSFKVSESGMISVGEGGLSVRIVDPISTADLFYQHCREGFQLQLPAGNWLAFVENDCSQKEVYAITVRRGFRSTLINGWANALDQALMSVERREGELMDKDTYLNEAKFYTLSDRIMDHLELAKADAENRLQMAKMVVMNTTLCLEGAFNAKTEVDPNGTVYVTRSEVPYDFMRSRATAINGQYQWEGLLPRPQFISDIDPETL